jgi:hypothetical protein
MSSKQISYNKKTKSLSDGSANSFVNLFNETLLLHANSPLSVTVSHAPDSRYHAYISLSESPSAYTWPKASTVPSQEIMSYDLAGLINTRTPATRWCDTNSQTVPRVEQELHNEWPENTKSSNRRKDISFPGLTDGDGSLDHGPDLDTTRWKEVEGYDKWSEDLSYCEGGLLVIATLKSVYGEEPWWLERSWRASTSC